MGNKSCTQNRCNGKKKITCEYVSYNKTCPTPMCLKCSQLYNDKHICIDCFIFVKSKNTRKGESKQPKIISKVFTKVNQIDQQSFENIKKGNEEEKQEYYSKIEQKAQDKFKRQQSKVGDSCTYRMETDQISAHENRFRVMQILNDEPQATILVSFKIVGTRVQWENLPLELQKLMSEVDEQYQRDSPLQALQNVVSNKIKHSIPEDSQKPYDKEFNLNKDQIILSILKMQDPTQFYDEDQAEELDFGSTGQVYKMKRKLDGKLFAMKRMQYAENPDCSDPDMLDQQQNFNRNLMLNEIALMKLNENDKVLKLIEVFDYKGFIWIITELMDGNLQIIYDLILENKDYSENVIKYMLREVLKGLQFLHNRHILHRDVRAANILFNKKGEIKLGDFGNSFQCTIEQPSQIERVGTPHWFAPEMIRGESGYYTSVDIWSFGILAIELACGQVPFEEATNQNDVMYNIVNEDIPQIQQIFAQANNRASNWSQSLQEFINYCLNKEEHDRPDATVLLDHPFLQESEDEMFKQELEFKYTCAVALELMKAKQLEELDQQQKDSYDYDESNSQDMDSYEKKQELSQKSGKSSQKS